ncbi:hypothetical protein [Bradyrhizobium sp. dw_411]|uniref:hypothetical protein n=1 Tax=Bradyrhizobium sp. dw_411 TaxID=2720082 RepID=UPI001BCCAE60|nr:hypothetical protein [Bradyrhizobium sp. dw_411]
MKPSLVLFALVLSAAPFGLLTPPAFGQVPNLNSQAVCNARDGDARLMHSVPLQSVAECVQDEDNARQQLGAVWASTSVVIRNRCESDGRTLGTTSYLDLLACIQIAEDEKSGPKQATGKP